MSTPGTAVSFPRRCPLSSRALPHFLLFLLSLLSLPHLLQHFLMHFLVRLFYLFYFRWHFSLLIANTLLPSSHTFLRGASSARLSVFSAQLPSSSPPPNPPSFFSLPASSLPAYCLIRSARLRRLIASPPPAPQPPPPVKKLSTRILNIITSILHIYCAALGCLSPQGENNSDVWGRAWGGGAGIRRRPLV